MAYDDRLREATLAHATTRRRKASTPEEIEAARLAVSQVRFALSIERALDEGLTDADTVHALASVLRGRGLDVPCPGGSAETNVADAAIWTALGNGMSFSEVCSDLGVDPATAADR